MVCPYLPNGSDYTVSQTVDFTLTQFVAKFSNVPYQANMNFHFAGGALATAQSGTVGGVGYSYGVEAATFPNIPTA